MKNNKLQKKVFLRTFGCQMNEYDSELVRGILCKEGFSFSDNEQQADVILLNTCSVRENAQRKVYGLIHLLRHQRKGSPLIIGVLGCMATHLREELLKNPRLNIDFIAGPDSYKRLPSLIREACQTTKKAFDLTLSEEETYSDIYPSRQEGINAWVAVMRGCNNFCSFCVVPYTRGRERSRSHDSIIKEVCRLTKEGFQQVTLLGQNVNSYQYLDTDFVALLDKVSEVEDIKRIRFISPHPKDFPERLLHVVAANPKVCKHIHLPLQSGNTRILNMMNRKYTQEEYLDLVSRIRSLCPSIALTTDIIVGFPTEADEEFEDTVKVMRSVEFDSAFIFKYSERPRTIASNKYVDDITEDKKTERIVKLNELQKEISLKKNQAHIGEIHDVLIEKEGTQRSEEDFQGRIDNNKIVIFPSGDYRRGNWVKVRITDATSNVLKGCVVEH